MPDEDQLFLRPAKPPRYNERNTTDAGLEFIMEQIAALRREQGEASVCDLVHWRRPRNRRDRDVLALLSGVLLDLSRLPMSNLRSWAVYVAAIATGLAPGLLGALNRLHGSVPVQVFGRRQ